MRTAHLPIPRRLALLAVTGTVLLGASPLAQRDNGIPKNPDERVITHVLNRLGYGPRPGDVERVQRMGLTAYINDQLNPSQIADTALATRLEQFPTLAMSQQQLVAEVFGPAEEQRRMLQQQQAAQARAAAAAGDPAMTTGTAAGTPPTPDALRQQLTPEQRMIQQAAQAAPNELMQAKILRAVMSERQLEEVLVDFWFNHFNVFIGKGQVRQYLNEYERDVIRPHVLGNFRELLGATAQSPAMLFYLDNFQSQAPEGAVTLGPGNDRRGRGGQPTRRPGLLPPGTRPGQIQIPIMPPPQPQPNRPQRGLNENYARELMELHTLGVDGGYTQQDVIALARILTGWTIDRPQQGGSFVFRPQSHDAGEKLLLGTKFPGGKGMEEGERALDLLAGHPSTAKHIAFKLAQRFVADTPPQSLVDRAAKKFTDTKGNLREVTRLIITSPEFFSADAYRAKVKTPFEFVASAARAANANIVNAQPIVNSLRTDLGMPLYGCQPPTGYSMTADAWVNTGSLLNRMNFALQLVSGGQQMQLGRGGRIGGPPPPPQRPDQPNRPGRANQQQLLRQQQQMARMPIQVDVKALAADTTDASRDALVKAVLAGQASDATRETLARAETPHHLIALTLGSPEFQRR
jgi:uncharacterized protein (DUF1800 family)